MTDNTDKVDGDHPEFRVAYSLQEHAGTWRAAGRIVGDYAKEADDNWYGCIVRQEGTLADHHARKLAKDHLERLARELEERGGDWQLASLMVRREHLKYLEQKEEPVPDDPFSHPDWEVVEHMGRRYAVRKKHFGLLAELDPTAPGWREGETR